MREYKMSSDRNTGANVGGSSDDFSRESGARAVGEGSDQSYRGSHLGDETVHRTVPERSTTVHEERVVHQQPPVIQHTDQGGRPVNVAVGADRQDGVRWGPIWAGLLTALTTFLLLELLFYSLGWLTLDPGSPDPGNSTALVTGILALVAFLLGGLIAGATALWKGLFSGLLHGFLVWALGVVAFIALTFFGASALLGSFGSLTNQLGVGPQQVRSTAEVSDEEAAEVRETADDAAGPAFWALLAPLLASMLGGAIGSKIWPRHDDSDPEVVRVHN
jgi:hypothetical protein